MPPRPANHQTGVTLSLTLSIQPPRRCVHRVAYIAELEAAGPELLTYFGSSGGFSVPEPGFRPTFTGLWQTGEETGVTTTCTSAHIALVIGCACSVMLKRRSVICIIGSFGPNGHSHDSDRMSLTNEGYGCGFNPGRRTRPVLRHWVGASKTLGNHRRVFTVYDDGTMHMRK